MTPWKAEVGRRREQAIAERQGAPLPGEGTPANMCLRCGMRGRHATPEACIEALRDRLARWE